jgi:hypothetical protein
MEERRQLGNIGKQENGRKKEDISSTHHKKSITL